MSVGSMARCPSSLAHRSPAAPWSQAAQAAPSISAGVALAQSLAGANGPICALGTLYFSADVRQALAEQSR